MSTPQLAVSSLALWSLAVLSVFAGRIILFTSAISVPEYAGWAFVAGAPVLLAAIVLRDRPTDSVARLLYDVEHAPRNSPLRRLNTREGDRP